MTKNVRETLSCRLMPFDIAISHQMWQWQNSLKCATVNRREWCKVTVKIIMSEKNGKQCNFCYVTCGKQRNKRIEKSWKESADGKRAKYEIMDWSLAVVCIEYSSCHSAVRRSIFHSKCDHEIGKIHGKATSLRQLFFFSFLRRRHRRRDSRLQLSFPLNVTIRCSPHSQQSNEWFIPQTLVAHSCHFHFDDTISLRSDRNGFGFARTYKKELKRP